MAGNQFHGDAAHVVQAGHVHGGIHLSGMSSCPLAASAAKAAARTVGGPPRQLPAAVDLVDRLAEREALDRLVETTADQQILVVLHGAAGIGKTAVALRWLHAIQDRYPGGQLYTDLRAEAGPAGSVAGVRARWLRALGVPAELVPDGWHEQAGLWRTVTTRRRMAVLLDDVTHAEQVLALVPVSGLVVATCRTVPSSLAAHAWTLALGPLAVDDAVTLLRRVQARELNGARTSCTAETRELRVLARRCGGLPLALCAAAAAGLPARAPAPLPATSGEILEDIITSARHRLPEPVARSYGLLATSPIRDHSLAAAGAALGVPPEDVQAHLTALQHAHLLTVAPDGRYTFAANDDARSAAATLSTDQQDAVFTRVRDHYLEHAMNASAAAQSISPPARAPAVAKTPSRALRQALQWLDREQHNIAELIHTAYQRGEHDTVLQLLRAIWPACRLRIVSNDRWNDLEVLAQNAADHTGDRRSRAQARDRRAICLIRAGRFDTAAQCLDQAEQLWQNPPEPAKLAGTKRRRGHLHRAKGDPETAITHYQEALAHYERLTEQQDPKRERHLALTRLDLAATYLDHDQPNTALPYALKAHQHFVTAGDPVVDRARSHRYLGIVHTRTGQFDAAAKHLQTALILVSDLADAELQAVIDAREKLARASGQPPQTTDPSTTLET